MSDEKVVDIHPYDLYELMESLTGDGDVEIIKRATESLLTNGVSGTMIPMCVASTVMRIART